MSEPIVPEILARLHRGAVATRALWQWAGGDEAAVAYLDDASAEWRALWARTSKEGEPTPLSLVREALYDHPGDAALLAAARELGERTFDDDASELADRLEAAVDDGADDAALWIALAGFPPRGFEPAYSALVERLEGRLTEAQRDAIEKSLAQLGAREAVPSGEAALEAFRQVLKAAPKRSCSSALPFISKLEAMLDAWSSASNDERAAMLEGLSNRLVHVASHAAIPEAAAARAFGRRLALVRELALGRVPPSMSELVRALVAALWSTRAGEAG